MSAPHPLLAVSGLAQAQGVLPHEMVIDHDGALVRMRTRAGLWVMRKSEDGSIYDRWSEADGMTLVKLTEDQIAGGTQAILDHLTSLSEAQA